MAGVRTTSKTYDELSPKWARCSACVDGQDAVHEKGETFLPRLTDETNADYAARLKRSDFFNATWRSIAGLAGLAFRKPPKIEVPAAIDPMLADIDMAGCSMLDMAKDLVCDAMEYGAFGLMVDHPPAPDNVASLSLAAAEANGMRPFIRKYDIESVINWRYARVANRWTLVMAVLKEEAEIPGDSEFETKCEDRYRVLDLDNGGFYRQRVFRITEKGEDELVSQVYPMMGGRQLNYIPFRICGELDEPPLIDLVDANIAHYQVNSDYRHGLHFTGLPTAVVSGYVPEDSGAKLYIGSTAAWVFPHPDAKASFLEFTGQGLSELREALKGLEQRMAALGARMIVDNGKAGDRTATEALLDHAGENSILGNIVTSVSESIEWALGVLADWAGASGQIVYQISREFNPAGLTAQQLTALLAAVQAGKLSDAEFYDLLQRNDVVDAQKPFEEHQAEIDMQGPGKPVVPGVAA